MSTPKEVLNALRDQLRTASSLSYVNDEMILKGRRDALTFFPNICLEVEAEVEEEYAYPVARIRMVAQIIGLMKVDDKDSQLCSDDDETTKGVLDLKNDILLAVDSDRTLGGAAIHVEVQDSDYTAQDYPIRGISQRVSILYQQTRAVRT